MSLDFKTIAEKTKANRIIRFFPNSDMRCNHKGLSEMAMENEINPLELSPGDFVVFMNRRGTMLKIFAPGSIIVFFRPPGNHRIDLDLIRYIPRFFNGTEFQPSKAIKEMLNRKLKRAA